LFIFDPHNALLRRVAELEFEVQIETRQNVHLFTPPQRLTGLSNLTNRTVLGLALFFAAAAAFAQGNEPARVDPGSAGSAYGTAQRLLKHLAAGDIEEAARLSNAPRQRYEALRDYRAEIGEEQFKQLFGRYFHPQNRLVAEYALGPRRLLIWDLGESAHHLAGQYYIEIDAGKFLMDDVPSEERSRLRRVLQDTRRGKAP
jgi:hypothetical protein